MSRLRPRIDGRTLPSSEVLRSYWHLAAERQRVYYARLSGAPGPWSMDPVISRYRFTNAYRAADRVSQDFIRTIYNGPQSAEDIVLRTLIFRFFNKSSTWSMLEQNFGELTTRTFDVDSFSAVMNEVLMRRERLYSAAYIVPPPPFGAVRKHHNHLLLIDHMMNSGLSGQLAKANSLKSVFETILSYPSLGPFLAYQLTIDLNYTTLINFSENDFVAPGPGALSGIEKCFPGAPASFARKIIAWMVRTQQEQCEFFGVDFRTLFGRPLTLIDCQNLFCEVDKYARVMHPDILGKGKRSRIKQSFTPQGSVEPPFFPPKWGLDTSKLPDTFVYRHNPSTRREPMEQEPLYLDLDVMVT
ncbi:hypothetical protein GS966_01195 [Rhodococcus hoagii]|nr:hypothetical protein [Prescottella equi]